MKSINNFIIEKLKLNAQSKLSTKDWTIKDAIEGDIIVAHYHFKVIFVFKRIFHTTEFGDVVGLSAYYNGSGGEVLSKNNDSHMGTVEDYLNGKIKYWRATNKEKNELFDFMKQRNYKWNESKKEFEKV